MRGIFLLEFEFGFELHRNLIKSRTPILKWITFLLTTVVSTLISLSQCLDCNGKEKVGCFDFKAILPL